MMLFRGARQATDAAAPPPPPPPRLQRAGRWARKKQQEQRKSISCPSMLRHQELLPAAGISKDPWAWPPPSPGGVSWVPGPINSRPPTADPGGGPLTLLPWPRGALDLGRGSKRCRADGYPLPKKEGSPRLCVLPDPGGLSTPLSLFSSHPHTPSGPQKGPGTSSCPAWPVGALCDPLEAGRPPRASIIQSA